MKLSDKGRKMIESFEGRRNRVYRDSAGLLTGGIGHLLEGTNWGEGDVIPDALVDKWFEEDVKDAERIANVLISVHILSQKKIDAVISLCFNQGRKILKNKNGSKTGIRRAFEEGRIQDVPAQIRRWDKAKDPKTGKTVVHPGLKTRRAAEARLFASGLYPAEQPEPQGRPTIRNGSSGQAVGELQCMLWQLGRLSFYPGAEFETHTEAGVRALQREHGLVVDGIVGPKTWAALQQALAGKGNQS